MTHGDGATPSGPEQEQELERVGAEELAAALRAGATTVAAHTERVLELAATRGTAVGAFAHLLPDRSRDQAGRADAAIAAGDARPLLGVPFPIKALTRIEGVPWDGGSAVLRGTVADVTDGVAQDVLAAGTVTIGTTTVPEFGFPCYTEPVDRAPARTPWDTRRTAGGSSGGAAAAVSTGIVPLAHGNDGGGSVRIPAACCGIVGIKSSRGLVSPGPYGTEGPGLVSDGILARTVRDAAIGLDTIVHVRPGDAFPIEPGTTTFRQACEHPEPLRGGLRVGLLTEPLNIDTTVHPAALRATERAAELMRGQGCEVTEIGAPFTPAQWQAFFPLWAVGAAAIPLPDGAEQHVTALTRWLREQGRQVTGGELAAATVGMQRVARLAGEAFATFDVILTPTLSGPPALPADLQLADPAADFAAQCAFTPWTSTWNMTGRAAISVPLHREELGGVELPFGVHLGAVRAGDDDLLLAVAALLERLDPWPLITEIRSADADADADAEDNPDAVSGAAADAR